MSGCGSYQRRAAGQFRAYTVAQEGVLATESGHLVGAMVPFFRVLLAHESEPGTNSHSKVGGVGSRTTRMGRETQKKRSHAISLDFERVAIREMMSLLVRTLSMTISIFVSDFDKFRYVFERV